MMREKRILIVDDYPQLVSFLKERLEQEGYAVDVAHTAEQARQILTPDFLGVCLLDVRLPDMGGLEFFTEIQETNPMVPVIFITAHASIDVAVEATKRGAFDFIAKGSDLLRRLTVAVKNAFDRLAMELRVRELDEHFRRQGRFGEFVTASPRLIRTLQSLQSVVNSQATILIQGESGTGKELIARAIHESSNRGSGPFVAVNCAGIPESLLESEVFGHEKGAFTGATSRKIGKFEAADGGTLFLDEVGELPLSLQAKLLRVLQDNTFQRVGSTKTVEADVRVIAATNKDLRAAVKSANFREDLFYRLAVFPVTLPSLRERPEDIPLLANHFLRRFAAQERKEVYAFTPGAVVRLTEYSFPGNVRELQNMVRYMVLLARGPWITKEEVDAAVAVHAVGAGPGTSNVGGFAMSGDAQAQSTANLEERLSTLFPHLSALISLKDLEEAYFCHAIRLAGGNVSEAAKAISVGRATIYRRISTSGIKRLKP